jgi:CubicO group peptidase (beta-lactamase class C family)
LKHSTAIANPIDQILQEAIAERAFPGAALVVSRQGKVVLETHAGTHTYDSDSIPVSAQTIYDLASLTKVLVTTPLCMRLFEAGKLRVDEALGTVIPEFTGDEGRPERVTFRHLLAHSSGLPAHRKYYEHAHHPEQLLKQVFSTPLEADPGTRAEYSDIGFILLGVALERLMEATLDVLAQREIFGPLGIACSFGPLSHVHDVPPTLEAVDFRDRRICGQVNDENAWVLGGVAGHAGLFGTARDVDTFARVMLRGGAPLFKAETVTLFARRESSPQGTSRALGWDTPSPPSQSGKYLSPQSYGHLGYTGTSLWIDPQRELAITLLTNRTYPDNTSQKIKQYRPRIHDAVIESFGLAIDRHEEERNP